MIAMPRTCPLRSVSGRLATLLAPYEGCNSQVVPKPFELQSDEYKALEYFESYMSNGLEINGPTTRK